MPTIKPRVSVTLEPEVFETFRELAKIQRRPTSALINELLVLVHPIQLKVLKASRNLEKLTKNSKAKFAGSLDKAQQQVDDIFGPLMDALDGLVEQSQPPHSNTGVTNSSDHTENPSNPHSRAFSTESPQRSRKVPKGTLQ